MYIRLAPFVRNERKVPPNVLVLSSEELTKKEKGNFLRFWYIFAHEYLVSTERILKKHLLLHPKFKIVFPEYNSRTNILRNIIKKLTKFSFMVEISVF